jgi:hypothetical protein
MALEVHLASEPRLTAIRRGIECRLAERKREFIMGVRRGPANLDEPIGLLDVLAKAGLTPDLSNSGVGRSAVWCSRGKLTRSDCITRSRLLRVGIRKPPATTPWMLRCRSDLGHMTDAELHTAPRCRRVAAHTAQFNRG